MFMSGDVRCCVSALVEFYWKVKPKKVIALYMKGSVYAR